MGSYTTETRLEDFGWSVRTLNVFRAYAITTIAELLSMSDGDLLSLQNFGRKSLQEVNNFLAEWEQKDPSAETPVRPVKPIPENILQLDISILHLGQKETRFRQAGITTVGKCKDRALLRQVRSVGRATLKLLNSRLEAVDRCVGDDGNLDLDRYCAVCDIPLLPSGQKISSGRVFLKSLPTVLDEIAMHLPDPVYEKVLRERLSKGPGDKKTLEEIATTVSDQITRERVRQKEKKLLQQLVGALVWEEYAEFGIHFRPDFIQWWKAAADFFTGHEDIDFDEFVSGLCEIWEVDAGHLTKNLPIILAIVTGESKLPNGFRTAIRLDHRFYGDLPDVTSNLPLSKLRLNKYASHLHELGLSTLGEFIEATRIGLLDEIIGHATQQTLNHLDLIARCLNERGLIDWNIYRDALELTRIPDTPPGSPVEFLNTLEANVLRVIETVQPTHRSLEIFYIRTSRPANHRPTLAGTAEILGTHGPTIKQEETLMLQQLNDLFIHKDFSGSPVWFDATWLEYWNGAAETYRRNTNDHDAFARELAMEWAIPSGTVNDAVPVLWAVLTGYPRGRPAKKNRKGEKQISSTPQKIGRIKLQGFKRVH